MNVSVHGIKAGFSLLEMMVVIGIIALMAAIVLPNLQTATPSKKRKQCVAEIQTLFGYAWQHALTTGKVHRLFFDFNKRTITIQMTEDTVDAKGDPLFVTVKEAYAKTIYQWPGNIIIKQFFIEGTDELNQLGKKTETVWCFIVPDGMAQPVIMNAIDTAQKDATGKDLQIGLVLNPFTARLKEYETFQKP